MGSELVTSSFQTLERMATTVVKAGMFGGIKTVEQAMVILMIADAENIKPIQAVMDYDVIGGKPALKAYSMLARYQRAGGVVKWLEASDERVTGQFTHPLGGTVVVTWDTARVTLAGLMRNPLHKTNPQQLKRARCISEGVRATFPSCIPTGVYTPEEAQDIAAAADLATQEVNVQAAIQDASKPALPNEVCDMYLRAMAESKTTAELTERYKMAYASAKAMSDDLRMGTFRNSYEARKGELEMPSEPAEKAEEKTI